jgi:diguanylate cyclase (GGDEF)-like protein/PAS domain S-box-containing protein
MLIALLSTSCLILLVLLIIQQRKNRVLQSDRQVFRALAENSPDLIFIYDRQGRRVYVNPVFTRLFGVLVEDIVGKSPADSPVLDSAQNRKLVDGIRHGFETGESSEIEVTFEDQQGLPHSYSMLLIPECDDEGQVNTVLGLNRNITAIREVERTVSNLVTQLPGFVFKFRRSADGFMSYPFASPRVEEFFGLRPEDIVQDATPLHAMTHPEDAPRVLKSILESARTMSSSHVEYRLLRPGYPERWVEVTATPEAEADGGVLWYGFCLDITERKRAEQDLKQALESIDGIINAIPDLLFEFDLNGTYLNVWAHNPTLLIAQKEILLGNTVRDVLLPDDAEITMSAIEEADRKGSSFGKVIRIELPQGTSWFELSVSRKSSSSDTDRHFIVLSRDITERRRMELLLATRERELRSLMVHLPANIARYTLGARNLYANPMLERTLDMPKEDLLGRTPMEAFPDGRYSEYQKLILATAASGNSDEMEMVVPKGDDEVEYHQVRFVAERDEKDEVVSVLSIGTDISERKHAELELAARERELRSLMVHLPANIARYTLDARNLYANPMLERTLDMPKEDLLGRTPMEAFPDGRYSEYQQRILATAASGNSDEMEMVVPKGDDDVEYHQVRFVAERDEKDEVVSVLSIGTDISERKQAELALAARERELRTLLESIPDNIARYTPDARRIYMNPMLERTYDKPMEYLLGRTPMECFPDGRFSEYQRRVIATAATGSNNEMELVMPMVNGEVEYHFIRFVPERNERDEVISVLAIGTDITERKRAELALAAREREFRSLAESLPDNIIRYDRKGLTFYVNPVLERTLGENATAMIGATTREHHPDGSYEDYAQLLDVVLASGEVGELEKQHLDQNGEAHLSQIRMVPEFDDDGEVVGVLAIGRDITESRRAEEKLRLAASVFTSTSEGIIVSGADNRILDVNEAFTRITGYTREEVIGENPSLLSCGRQVPEFYAEMWRTLQQTGHWAGEIWNRRKDGEEYAEWLTISVVNDDQGKLSHYVAVFADITLIKEQEQQLQRIAHHDALTGLPNRLLFLDRLKQAVAQARRSGSLLAVCYGDLDGFKPVNDRYGHEAGDKVLVTIGKRMQDCVRVGDTVGRIGGDEFVILLMGLEGVEECRMVLTRLLDTIAQPIQLGGHSVSVSASLGVALFPQDDADPDLLLRHADQAMYQAKRGGKSSYRLFNPDQP